MVDDCWLQFCFSIFAVAAPSCHYIQIGVLLVWLLSVLCEGNGHFQVIKLLIQKSCVCLCVCMCAYNSHHFFSNAIPYCHIQTDSCLAFTSILWRKQTLSGMFVWMSIHTPPPNFPPACPLINSHTNQLSYTYQVLLWTIIYSRNKESYPTLIIFHHDIKGYYTIHIKSPSNNLGNYPT